MATHFPEITDCLKYILKQLFRLDTNNMTSPPYKVIFCYVLPNGMLLMDSLGSILFAKCSVVCANSRRNNGHASFLSALQTRVI